MNLQNKAPEQAEAVATTGAAFYERKEEEASEIVVAEKRAHVSLGIIRLDCESPPPPPCGSTCDP